MTFSAPQLKVLQDIQEEFRQASSKERQTLLQKTFKEFVSVDGGNESDLSVHEKKARLAVSLSETLQYLIG
jgi:RecB family exonuclease